MSRTILNGVEKIVVEEAAVFFFFVTTDTANFVVVVVVVVIDNDNTSHSELIGGKSTRFIKTTDIHFTGVRYAIRFNTFTD